MVGFGENSGGRAKKKHLIIDWIWNMQEREGSRMTSEFEVQAVE